MCLGCSQLFLFGRSFLSAERRIGSRSELVLELLDSPCGVNVLQFTRKKWMTSVANVNLEFLTDASCLKGISTATCDGGIYVVWMDACFHDTNTLEFSKVKNLVVSDVGLVFPGRLLRRKQLRMPVSGQRMIRISAGFYKSIPFPFLGSIDSIEKVKL